MTLTLRTVAAFSALIMTLLLWPGTATCSSPPVRIVSLAPAMTETLYALGLGGRIVGVTNVCDYPPEARNKATVGGMSNPSLEAIVALKPDMVVMSRDGNPKETADRLSELGIKVYVFTAVRLAELPAGIRAMGRQLGALPAAEKLAGKIESAIRVPGAHSKMGGCGKRFAGKPKALFVIWPDPLIVAGPGTIIDDAMALSGLENIAADAKVSYPHFSLEAVAERRPDQIIMGSGYGMNKPCREFLKRLGALGMLRKVRICYAGDSLYRPGPRIPAGIAQLKKCGEMP